MKYQGFKYPTRNQDGSPVQYQTTFTPGKKRAGVQGYRLELNGEFSPTIPKYTDAVLTWMRVNVVGSSKVAGILPDQKCNIIVVLG